MTLVDATNVDAQPIYIILTAENILNQINISNHSIKRAASLACQTKMTDQSEPDLSDMLTFLRGLDFHNPCVRDILASPDQLAALKAMDLHGYTSLTMLTDSLGQLFTLEILTLSECHLLATLPKSLGNLSALKKLDLSG